MNYDFPELDNIFEDSNLLDEDISGINDISDIDIDETDRIIMESYKNKNNPYKPDYILNIKHKKNLSEDLKELKRLKLLKDKLANQNPKELENEFFSNHECFTEREKIKLEALYVRTKLLKNKDEYEKLPSYDSVCVLTRLVLASVDIANTTDLKKLKQALILIELKLDLNINFYSEVENVYKLKMSFLNDKTSKKKGL